MAAKKPKTPAKTSWWNFTGENEAFEARNPDQISRLYFPLCNEAGLLSAVTPTLQGDIKTGQNAFVTLPESEQDLHNTRSSRNFWVYVEGKGPWSATGSSAAAVLQRASVRPAETTHLEAGALWHRITRVNKAFGLRSVTTSFIPAGPEQVEIMRVELTNTGRRPLSITPTAAIPLFARSADNLRDHRHVTSLLHRIALEDSGVLVTPTMSFDERGHHANSLVYAVLGCESEGQLPVGSFPTVDSFIGEGGTFDAPRAVYENRDTPELTDVQLQGREAVGALRFRTRKLAPGKTLTYLVFTGIGKERKEVLGWLKAYGTADKTAEALTHTQAWWKERLDRFQVETGDADYGRWVRWVTMQPMLRKIFGCSFLPDFDYGRGGRGWRDLWQDCLALLLLDPGSDIRPMLLNNFGGVRPNGTNATIIGKTPGEFIADRNGISRTWMDHGVWPWITTELYVHQTGDLKFLLEEAPYFLDQDSGGKEGVVKGSILEHALLQHLTAYFNAGEHGHIRLEDADWNDGLDMAHDRGESVAFTAVYAGNLKRIGETLLHLKEVQGLTSLSITKDLFLLLESSGPTQGLTPEDRRQRLETYRRRLRDNGLSKPQSIAVTTLAQDLFTKSEALANRIRDTEWVRTAGGQCWFNGYYDNNGARVEGDTPNGVRMTLTGQVFPIMSEVATNEQVQQSFAAARKILKDKKLGGYRLNTDFGGIQLQLGRAFSFAYGEKENGAFFSHMIVMFANALYRRDFVEEGHDVLSSLYRMCMNADTARIYPGMPEYFNGEGRGLYHYLTGSASWYLLTVLTQVLGVRGEWGDLLLAPKLMPEEFGSLGRVTARTWFAGKRLTVIYVNPSKKPFGQYTIQSVLLQGRSLTVANPQQVRIPRKNVQDLAGSEVEITVSLG
jgi:cellobiose phosphorylase